MPPILGKPSTLAVCTETKSLILATKADEHAEPMSIGATELFSDVDRSCPRGFPELGKCFAGASKTELEITIGHALSDCNESEKASGQPHLPILKPC